MTIWGPRGMSYRQAMTGGSPSQMSTTHTRSGGINNRPEPSAAEHAEQVARVEAKHPRPKTGPHSSKGK